jgi:hypothetical protein
MIWFWAAYLMTTDKRGLSALLLQRQLGITRYETAWMMLHKLRRAMVNRGREPLQGEVELDDTWIQYEGDWTDSAVRRFAREMGASLDDLLC